MLVNQVDYIYNAYYVGLRIGWSRIFCDITFLWRKRDRERDRVKHQPVYFTCITFSFSRRLFSSFLKAAASALATWVVFKNASSTRVRFLSALVLAWKHKDGWWLEGGNMCRPQGQPTRLSNVVLLCSRGNGDLEALEQCDQWFLDGVWHWCSYNGAWTWTSISDVIIKIIYQINLQELAPLRFLSKRLFSPDWFITKIRWLFKKIDEK